MDGKTVIQLATAADARDIAALHARSWQQSYRGMLTDEYLDHHAPDERREVWQAAWESC